ncbi:multicomponent Na+:H+ antiporter subunit G [Loktanella sp. PT4BL]|jgi:multicomponent Na+:H+ antiporter subunit G|uniref:monovalent cation/H(+) antiporter subunit G n=1 Tax=Rhodobacterales TaxID=204455 RepID=UPI000D761E57|nr:monovalent cation/H(+) antiporter subunit G [Loktanella sp. PT4BL]PXW70236.1 multicomponent Na+:H+ antiporter subunit G [Loktanella sp. PT4BL]
MINVIIGIFLLLGGFFALVAAIGVLRLPDVLTRMHASTKAGVLGSSLILIGGAFYLAQTEVTARVIATIIFLMLTSPIGAHMIGRASVRDLKDKHDKV